MATKLQNLDLEIAHFQNCRQHIPRVNELCQTTIDRMLELGTLQISTWFEHAVAYRGGHTVVSLDKGDLLRNNKYSDAKLSTVRTSSRGKLYSAPVTNIFNKVGTLRVQVYERIQNRFYYFAIPRSAYKQIPKTSNIDIPFEKDGTPRRKPKREVKVNWWNYETKSFEDMANKH